MANIKISQLPAKGANLEATDLVEISEFDGSGYVSKSITGQEIIDGASGGGAVWGGITGTLSSQTDLNTALSGKQSTLISGVNIKTINSTSLLSGGNIDIVGVRKYVNTTLQSASATGETLVGSYLIPANTFAANGSFEIALKVGSTSGAVSLQAKLYINTSNTLTGATLIATSGNAVASGYFNIIRNSFISSSNILTLNSSLATNSDLVTGGNTQSSIAFDVTANRYLLVSLTPSVPATAEVRGVKFVQNEA